MQTENDKKRYFFKISYDGSRYHGWQKQNNALGIQEIIEKTISQIFKSEIDIIGSGRTDTGVHAKKQFFHCDLPSTEVNKITATKLKFKLNCMLPQAIAIHSIFSANSTDAHARYSALEREYKYYIHTKKNPFLYNYSTYYSKFLDIKKMNEACTPLIGEKDFKAFSTTHTQVNHYLCNIKYAKWEKYNDNLVITIIANRFLRGMVRTIIGTLVGLCTDNDVATKMAAIIDSKDRTHAGKSFPAKGLYLTGVSYKEGLLSILG